MQLHQISFRVVHIPSNFKVITLQLAELPQFSLLYIRVRVRVCPINLQCTKIYEKLSARSTASRTICLLFVVWHFIATNRQIYSVYV